MLFAYFNLYSLYCFHIGALLLTIYSFTLFAEKLTCLLFFGASKSPVTKILREYYEYKGVILLIAQLIKVRVL